MSNATEAAVKYAAKHGIDLADVKASGTDGRVTRFDVQAHIASRNGGETEDLPGAQPPAMTLGQQIAHASSNIPGQAGKPRPAAPPPESQYPKLWRGRGR